MFVNLIYKKLQIILNKTTFKLPVHPKTSLLPCWCDTGSKQAGGLLLVTPWELEGVSKLEYSMLANWEVWKKADVKLKVNY